MDGPDHQRENTLPLIAAALACGFGVETDIRFLQDGTGYISHDALEDEPVESAGHHITLWAKYPEQLVALNIKETGWEEQTLSLLRHHRRLQNTMLFDMELIEPEPGGMAAEFQRLEPACELAARVSDRGESIDRALALPGQYIWLDEMDGTWATQMDIVRLKDAGRTILAVSRDLHRVPVEQCVERWRQFAEWRVDGICTDWPKRLAERLGLSAS